MVLAVIFLAAVCLLITRVFLNWLRLGSVPGPFFAGASDCWRAYYQYRGKLRPELLRLHKNHGPVVRYGVNSVSFSDPSAISVIYGSTAGFVTVSILIWLETQVLTYVQADSYKVLVGISNGKEVASLVSTADEAKHGELRRSVAKAFTPTGSLDYETHVDETIAELMDAIARHSIVDLADMMIYYSMDAATRISSGETLGCLQSLSDVGGTIQLVRDRFNHWGWWSSLPGLEWLVYRNPISMRIPRAPSSMAAKAVSKLQARSVNVNEHSGVDLLQKFIQASQDHPKTLDRTGVVGLLMSTISGAGDTTATTVSVLIYNLITHPRAFKESYV